MFQCAPVSYFSCLVLGTLLTIYISESRTQASFLRPRRQSSNEKIKAFKGGICVLPKPLQNGKYRPSEKRCPKDDDSPACQMLPGSFVPPDWVLFYECDRGYVQDSTKTVAVCHKSEWLPSLPVCNKLCPPLRSQTLDLKCIFQGNKVSCDLPIRPGTVAIQECKEYHNSAFEQEASNLTCLDNGLWNYPLSYCTPDDICKLDGDTMWACKKITQCPKAREGLNNRVPIIPETCYISEKDPYICCEPETDNRVVTTSKPQPEERKSVKMCKKYAESVYLTIPKPKEQKIDTCALVEPIDAPVPEGTRNIPELSSNAEPREFPHIAVIGYGKKSHKRPDVRCVGSLISERYVLSVAKCSDTPIGPAAWVRLGDYNVNSNKDDDESDSRSVIYDIIERINHPDYNPSGDPNDIEYNDLALYKLNTSVKFNEYIRPICLHAGDPFAKTFALTTGWGPVELGERPNEILQKVNLTIVEDEECSNAYKFNGFLSDGLNMKLSVCAALVDGRDTCMSLDGSPLQIRLRDPYCMYSLAGVAFFNRPCFVKSPGVYIRVSHYLEWIEGIAWP